MKILIVDNYDSFTFNLYQYISEVFGVLPTVVKNRDETVDVEEFDAIVISPGPGTPYRESDTGICERVIKTTDKPLLGICLGHQSIVAYMGGSVEISGVPYHGRTSDIVHGGSGIFSNLPNPLEIVRYHSLIAHQPLPEELIATAFTQDGMIMGVEHRTRPMWGVQFHPESVYTNCGRQIIENFKMLVDRYYIECKKPALLAEKSALANEGERRGQVQKTDWHCHFETLDVDVKAVDVFRAFYKKSKYSFWLDSSSINNAEARFSFMGDTSGAESFWFAYDVETKNITLDNHGKKTELTKCYQNFVAESLAATVIGAEDLPFDFCGGLVGFQGYELKSETESVDNKYSSKHPDASGVFVDRFIAFDHKTGLVYIVAIEKGSVVANTESDALTWLETTSNSIKKIEKEGVNTAANSHALLDKHNKSQQNVKFTLEDGEKEYIEKIAHCKEYILQGESYEICLTNRIRSTLNVEPFALYDVLRQVNPAPRAAYLHCPEFSVLCSSPEKFISVGRNAVVEAKPIKGTRKRGATEREDAALIQDLAESEKDRAENLMIVDLLRNDLNRVCEAGSVWVPKAMQIESYASVHQLVSTVRGRLKDQETLASLFGATFPPGSMTGAPKTRTLEIIDHLESSARGIYSGSIGYMSLNGASELNVAIRTLVASDNAIEIGVGGAITWLSDPEEEFEEILIKGRALMRAITKYATGDENRYQIIGITSNDVANASLGGISTQSDKELLCAEEEGLEA
ncbi:aminodeoxychorismate synthase component I [Pseudoalteromonas rhizosphaerae]|uniref:aminodeoxychorismate synthase component I n=1 Tax=Pseudoalteromonas rhizosphaerae TaxID=2518973 RepID=UPI0021473F4B|nr:aminodeoxychorismate synthase component I [Pseudoalteromonas rhizosphaerae]